MHNKSNRALFIRLTAYAMIGAASVDNQEHLIRLTVHEYGLIARTSATRLVQLLGENSFKKLSAIIDDSIQKRQSDSLAGALRYAEIEFFGLVGLW
jgi:hypothetical protein